MRVSNLRVTPKPAVYLPRARRFSGKWVQYVARVGFAAEGIVYIVVGLLALQVATGTGGETTDAHGAISAIAREPFGAVLLWAMGIGLFAFMTWRMIQAVLDPENEGRGMKKATKRIGYFLSGLAHASLAAFAIEIAMGSAQRGTGNGSQQATAQALAQPFGEWLVGLIGLIVIVVGFVQLGTAYTASFMDKMRPGMTVSQRTWAERSGRWGYSARGIVLALIGWFLVQAAWQADPNQARGLDGALAELARQPYGPWLLGGVALGLALFGVFMIIMARFRWIRV